MDLECLVARLVSRCTATTTSFSHINVTNGLYKMQHFKARYNIHTPALSLFTQLILTVNTTGSRANIRHSSTRGYNNFSRAKALLRSNKPFSES